MRFSDYLDVGVFFVLVIWVLGDFMRMRRARADVPETGNASARRKYEVFAVFVALCSTFISLFHVGFVVNVILNQKSISLGSVFVATSWVSATLYGCYCKSKGAAVTFPWPLVLVSWWVFFSIKTFFTILIELLDYWNSMALPDITDFVSFPLSALISFCAIFMSSGKSNSDLNQPLIGREETYINGADHDNFSNAGFWSCLTFGWLNPIFERGRAEQLKLHHVPRVPPQVTAEKSSFLLQELLRRQKPGFAPLPRAIMLAVWRPLAINALFAAVYTISSYMGPLLIANFVEFLAKKGSSDYGSIYGYKLVCLIFAAKTVESLSQRQWYFGSRKLGIQVQAALMVSLYNRSLLIKYSGTISGKVINFLNVDVEKIEEFFVHIHDIWLLPVQISFALGILYRNLGTAAALSSLLATIILMVGNLPLARLQQRFHHKIMEAKDSRMKATTEILRCMRIIKLYAWESSYLEKLLQLRQIERSWLTRYIYTHSVFTFLFWASPTLVSVIAFLVCIIMKTSLTAATVLSALATFRNLQDPIYNLPELVSNITQTKVSLYRIQEFIKEEEEEEEQMQCRQNYYSKSTDVAVEIEPGEYNWGADSGSKKSTIKIDKKIQINTGQKVAICGSVGSGKSSLLCGITGEIPRTSGTRINVLGSTAYVPQSAWIQTGTIQENVLFGKEMERGLYEEVLQACALERDIRLWGNGDLTIVGERGKNLSGGQKQRIQLARALYSNSDVYLLDDPFSAVDAHTGEHLYKECLLRFLTCKTVIYATHQMNFVHAADLILVLKGGNLVQSGKYSDLIKDTNGEFLQQMAAHRQSLSQVAPIKENISVKSARDIAKETMIDEVIISDPDGNSKQEGIIQEEEREFGRVKWHVYHTFITSAYRGALIPVLLLCHVLFQVLQMASNYWIAWATEAENQVTRGQLIGTFALLSAGSSAFVLGRAVLLATVSIETAQQLFVRMTRSIFRAPISFFDSTPSSRILARSSTDQNLVDRDIPHRVAGLVFAIIQLLCIIILMSEVAWPVIILFIIVIGVSIWYQNYYICAARELARMVGIQKAPILHHFSESIAGATTIRCFNQEKRFAMQNLNLIDDYSRITFHNGATMEWLCVRINFLFNLVFLTMLTILVSMPRNVISPSFAGLAATYGLSLNVLQAWVSWNFCNVENKMISVERILQFCNISSESPLVIENFRPEHDWPRHGTIELENLHIRYRQALPMVLKGISCTFPGGKKIGVVGRTGSGKSTLIQALFRVIELKSGRITIDGVDISQIGLHDLRSKLSIIPQEPALFHGNIRTNLDPLQQHSDQEIWEVLYKCQLGDIVKRDQRLLDSPVSEDGENWSVGQRQLVCLARVLLKKRRILILDEATASVDTATDNLIQKTIREETSNCTVITVAHRVPTVIDSDAVLVLNEGKILELGCPSDLLKDDSSAFSKLVMKCSGRSNF